MTTAKEPADLAARLADLERRVAELEAAGRRPPEHAPQQAPQQAPQHTPDQPPDQTPDRSARSPDDDPLWALTRLRAMAPAAGAVLFTGRHRAPEGGHHEWQWAEPTEALLDSDWSLLAPSLSALAHPARLKLVKEVLAGTHAVSDLQAGGSFGTTGQIYHHLRQLVGAGWLRPSARGSYTVPAERVIPLLVILSAARR